MNRRDFLKSLALLPLLPLVKLPEPGTGESVLFEGGEFLTSAVPELECTFGTLVVPLADLSEYEPYLLVHQSYIWNGGRQ